MHRGGRGDARASCASPLGTPLPGSITVVVDKQFITGVVDISEDLKLHLSPRIFATIRNYENLKYANQKQGRKNRDKASSP
jgi:hypothetical protein